MKIKVLLCSLAVSIAGAPVIVFAADAQPEAGAAALADSLDGTTWKVRVSPDKARNGTGTAYDDVFHFKDGMVSCQEDGKRGFDPTEYAYDALPSSATFSMIQAGPRQGKKRYEGAVKGRTMEGKMAWETDRGDTQYYVFKGSELSRTKGAPGDSRSTKKK